MGRKKNSGCGITFLLICAGIYYGVENGTITSDTAAKVVFFAVVILLVLSFLFRERKCQICDTPIKRKRYRGKFNGKRYSVICPECKKSLDADARRQRIRELKDGK